MPHVQVDVDNFYTESGKYTTIGKLNLKHDSQSSGTGWKQLFYSSTEPVGTSIKFRTRTSETETGITTAIWSDYLTTSGPAITSPSGRWIEIEVMLETSNAATTPVLHGITVSYGSNPGDVVWQKDLTVNAIDRLSLTETIGSIGLPGKYNLQGTLTSFTGQTIAESEYPFYIIQGNTVLLYGTDKKVYKPGETVTITGEVRNLASIEAGLVFDLKQKSGSGAEETLNTATFTLLAQGTHPFTVATIAGTDGIYSLSGTVTQNGSTLVQITDQYEVSDPELTAILDGPDSIGSDPFTLTLTVSNAGKTDAAAGITISDDHGQAPETQDVTIKAGDTRIFQYVRELTSATTYTISITGDLNRTLTKTISFSGTASTTNVGATVVADKSSYQPNEQVVITGTIENLSEALENLSAWILIQDSNAQTIYTDSFTITQLLQGQRSSFNKYWNTGIYPAGTYTAKLLVSDGAILISTAETRFSILSVTEGGTGLSASLQGTISVETGSLLSGEPVNVSYTVRNIGNANLSELSLSVFVVDARNNGIVESFPRTSSLAMGATYADSTLITTTGYSARDYLVVLRAGMNGVEETLAGTYFRIEGAPSAPSLAGPAVGSDVLTFTPELIVNNASDPNDDRITYQFELYPDSGLSQLVLSSSGINPDAAGGTTAWTVSAALNENQAYFWRARAFDGKLYGPWMETASFRVNTVNDSPATPTPTSPSQGASVDTFRPVLTVNNGSDPDSTNLTHDFEIGLDPDFVQSTARGVSNESSLGSTSWLVPLDLEENTWYYWRARTDDRETTSPWSRASAFFVNTANSAPTVPVVQAPENGSVVNALEADITILNSSDPDSSTLTYVFEADTAITFDSAELMSSGMVAEGQGTSTWRMSGFRENTEYYLRVKASDGIAESAWSGVVRFFANGVNEPPTTPTLANPSDGSGVTVFTPILSINNAADPDRDGLTYEFEVSSDSAMTEQVASQAAVAEDTRMTSWTIPVELAENGVYYWRSRASDGILTSPWMPAASFTVNTANDAPGAPAISSPVNGSRLTTLTPRLSIANSLDPDSDSLTYDFEVYRVDSSGVNPDAGTLPAESITGVAEDRSGTTSIELSNPLSDNAGYQWRARAYDGERYGPWTATASFSVWLSGESVNAAINFDPDTLSKKSKGNWVMVYIELPGSYHPSDIDITSLRLEGVPAEIWPYAVEDHDKNGVVDLAVKFRRSEVVKLLPTGESVTVRVTGNIGSTTFEGSDTIRVTE